MSDDERRIVHIMGAFAGNPDLIVLDDPTFGVSSVVSTIIVRGISVLKGNGKSRRGRMQSYMNCSMLTSSVTATIIVSISNTNDAQMIPFDLIAVFQNHTVTHVVNQDTLIECSLGFALSIYMADLQAQCMPYASVS